MPTLVLTKDDLVGAGILNTIEIPSGGGGGGTDADVTAFLTAASISDNTIETSLNTFVTTLKNESLWDEIITCYPFVTDKTDAIDIQSQFKFNLKDPQDTDAAHRLTTIGSVTFNTTGIITGAGGGQLRTYVSVAVSAIPTGNWHRGSFTSIQGYWNTAAQVLHTGQYNIVGGGTLGTHIHGRVDDNTMILCGPLAHRTGVSDAIYGGDYVVSSIAAQTPGANQFFAGYYLRTNSDADWQVNSGEYIGRLGFSPAYNENEISLYIALNPVSKEKTLTLQNAINQLQTDLGRATH